MLHTHVLHADGHVQVQDGIGLARCAPEGATVWVDVVATSEVGLAQFPAEWRFHQLALEDCIHPQRRAKYERYPNHLFLVLQALDTHTKDAVDTVAVRVFVRDGLVVTVRNGPCSALDRVEKLLIEDRERVGDGADRIVHAIVDAVVDEFVKLLEEWEDRVDHLGPVAAEEDDRSAVHAIVSMRRDLAIMRRTILAQKEVVQRLKDGLEEKDPRRLYFQDVLDHVDATLDTAGLLAESCTAALQLRSDRINEGLNRVMKYLAIVSTLMLPMTVVSGVFGMNFDVIPTAHAPAGFYGAIGLMLASALVLVAWFRWKRWL